MLHGLSWETDFIPVKCICRHDCLPDSHGFMQGGTEKHLNFWPLIVCFHQHQHFHPCQGEKAKNEAAHRGKRKGSGERSLGQWVLLEETGLCWEKRNFIWEAVSESQENEQIRKWYGKSSHPYFIDIYSDSWWLRRGSGNSLFHFQSSGQHFAFHKMELMPPKNLCWS